MLFFDKEPKTHGLGSIEELFYVYAYIEKNGGISAGRGFKGDKSCH